MADIKFCGLTRAADAQHAAALGARYLGVIFAGGPRLLTPERARDVLAGASRTPGITSVGVFGVATPDDIAEKARAAGVGVVQLHGDPDPATVADVRTKFGGKVWAVLRVEKTSLPASAGALFATADGVVLDAKVEGRLGGTGVRLDWDALAPSLRAMRGQAKLILAGGLNAANVAEAIRVLEPDVVDVSSGVESAPGIKDHDRMRAFADAVRDATVLR